MGYRRLMPAEHLIAVVGSLVLVAAVVVYVFVTSKRRREGLAKWIEVNGWSRRAAPASAGVAGFLPIVDGVEKICVDLTPALPQVAMMLRERMAGRNGNARSFEAVLVAKAGVELPEVAVRCKRWQGRRDGSIGSGSSERALYFDDAAFRKRFEVQAPEPDQGYQLVNPAMRELLLASPGFDIAVRGREVVFARGGHASAAQYEALVAFAKAFFERLPSDLLAGATPRPG